MAIQNPTISAKSLKHKLSVRASHHTHTARCMWYVSGGHLNGTLTASGFVVLHSPNPLRFSWSLYDKEARRLILLNHSNVRRVRVKERWRNWSRFWMCNSINSSFAIWYILKTPKCYSIQHGFMWLFGLKRIKWEEITKKSITSAKSKGTTELTTNEIERKWNRKANNVECKTKSHCEPERSIGKVKKKKELKTESNAEKTNVSGEKDFCRRDVQSMSIWARWWRDQRKPQQQQ